MLLSAFPVTAKSHHKSGLLRFLQQAGYA